MSVSPSFCAVSTRHFYRTVRSLGPAMVVVAAMLVVMMMVVMVAMTMLMIFLDGGLGDCNVQVMNGTVQDNAGTKDGNIILVVCNDNFVYVLWVGNMLVNFGHHRTSLNTIELVGVVIVSVVDKVSIYVVPTWNIQGQLVLKGKCSVSQLGEVCSFLGCKEFFSQRLYSCRP
jgi:hypothetical protein